MAQEDKELLLKDLSARLPYGVIVKHFDTNIDSEGNLVDICILDDITTTIINEGGYENIALLIESKPYLRPMSSMTEVERKEYGLVLCDELSINQFDWLNAHHFDYRGLIPKGLAIEVNESNNPYKN